MRIRPVTTVTLLPLVLALACDSGSTADQPNLAISSNGGTGIGIGNAGGSPAVVGTSGTTATSGGSSSVRTGLGGANPGTGGSIVGAGGTVQGNGGGVVVATGGTVMGTGGGLVVGSGGSVDGTGGATSGKGGAIQGTGGAVESNGGTVASSGGTVGSGGTPQGEGGTMSTCSDDPPPDQPQTCAEWASWGTCDDEWFASADYCAASCNRCSGEVGNGGGPGSGGSHTGSGGSGSGGRTSSVEEPPRLSSGTNGWATRYWDCCKPHCGWTGNVSGGNPLSSCDQSNQSLGGNYDEPSACNGGGRAHMCYSYAPWAVSDTLSYGFAAITGAVCGKCYQLQFDGGSHNGTADAGSQSLSNKTLIVQVINTGGVQQNQFDVLVPGGGVGDFNACSNQWGSTNLGEQYGGVFLACQKNNNFDYGAAKSCASSWCDELFGSKPDLLAGCKWFVEWYGFADNPSLIYKEIACPAGIKAVSGLSG